MADQDRQATHALIQALRDEPWRFDFFQAMRLIECHHADKPRLGTSIKALDDPVRLAQAVEMDFAPSALSSWESGKEGLPDRLVVRFLGLFGPNGPLPLHLTEYARDRIRHHGDRTFARFADIFHHRLLCLFYRAWADTQPTVYHDRPEVDRFGVYLGSLFGIGMPSLRERDAMSDRAKLLFTGLLSCQSKHADGLRAIVEAFLGVATYILEFVGEWMEISIQEQTRLGAREQAGRLGMSTVVGGRVFGCQHKIRLVLGPLAMARYRDMLPGGAGLFELIAIVRNYIGDELVWDVNLILRQEDIPPLRLDGGAQLGWTSWLGEKKDRSDADDLTLNPFLRV
ncbi:MAG: type VI secretion system baseplate subunit TssG [Methylococcaceae bacterium]|nr:type VI secretion system baseplate subunit TssG [Methylococcaceae bacterium]